MDRSTAGESIDPILPRDNPVGDGGADCVGTRRSKNVIRFGLTGGVGMGKSTAAGFLQQAGIPVVDSDAIARQIVEPGEPALEEIRKTFGGEVIGLDGRLQRERLASRVFSDPEARRQLEAVLHPRIRSLWQAQFAAWDSEGRPAAVAMIPLLFETDAAGGFDVTICAACSATTQRHRLQARGWTDDQIDRRIAAQMPVEKKMALSDYVVWTEGALEVHEAQLRRIIS